MAMSGPEQKGNTTMPLSESQVLGVSKQPAVAKNDQSMWKGLVVGADDFAPAPPKRGSRAMRWGLIGVLGAGAAAGGVYALGGFGGGSHDPPPAAQAPVPVATPAPSPPPPAPADAAAMAAAPVDAPAPAGPPGPPGPPAVDAVSSVAPPIAKSPTAPAKKKKPTAAKKRSH
jgi:hypothetical protein